MTDFLLFQLYGPLASWGEIAVGEARITADHPGRSALIGLLAAALGLRRDDEETQQQLAQDYWFAVRVISSGTFLRDYHTAQVPSTASLKGFPHYTRREELAPSRNDLNTILSSRDYRCDAYYQVAVEGAAGAPRWSLAALEEALRWPKFPLYLGRKSCPPALPLQPQRVSAPDLRTAFRETRFTGPDDLTGGNAFGLKRHGGASLYWDEGMRSGVPARETFTRRDQPRSRRRWHFDERIEHHASLPLEGQ